jgi:hypothetical protein
MSGLSVNPPLSLLTMSNGFPFVYSFTLFLVFFQNRHFCDLIGPIVNDSHGKLSKELTKGTEGTGAEV